MTKERRAFARIKLDLPASMSLYQMDVYHTGSIVDLSMGGCFIPIDEDLPINEECHISLTAGEGLEAETIDLVGNIVRCTPQGVGIQFRDKSPAADAILQKILDQKKALAS